MANILKIWDESTQQYVGIPAIVGPKGPKGDPPVKGIDYWTENDKAEVIQDVAVSFPTKSEAQAYADAKDAAIAAAKSSGDNAQADVDALESKIGTVASGKTVVQMISEAQTAATYNDTAIKNRVSTIESDYLKASDKTELTGLINTEKGRMDAFLNAADVGEAAVDTLKEIQTYITTDGEAAAEMTLNIAANASAITAEQTRATSAENALSGRVTTLEGVKHTHANATELAKFANGDKAKLDSAMQSVTVLGTSLSDGDSLTVAAAKTALGLGSAAYANTSAFDAAGAASAVQGNTTGTVKSVETAISAIKDGATIDSFADVESALAGKQATGDYATKAQAQGYANAKDAAIAAAKQAGDDAQDAVDDLSSKIGTVASGKTVVGMIAEAQTAATYNDTSIKNRIKTIEDDYLKSSDKTELSTAIATEKGRMDTFLASAEIGGAAIDTLKEIQTYITNDGTAAAQMTTNISANATAIETEASRAATAESALDTRIDALEETDHSHNNKALLDTYTQTNVNIADAVSKKHSHSNISELNLIASGDKAKWDAAQAKAHEHSNKTVIDGITSAKVTSWSAAEQNAKDYADSLSDNYAETVHNHTKSQITDLVMPTKLSDFTNDIDLETPHIGVNGNWYIGSTDTGNPSRGDSGVYVGTDEPETANIWINPDGDDYDIFATKEYVDDAIANISGTGGTGGTSGTPGTPGAPGFSPTITTSKTGKNTTITITDVNGTKTATIVDGSDGKSFTWRGEWEMEAYAINDVVSENGSSYIALRPTQDYENPSSSPSTWQLMAQRGANGSPGSNGYTPVKGTDYWTAADKAAIVQDVLAALPVYAGGVR